jgi:protein involved in sex pheromone biosynthesis
MIVLIIILYFFNNNQSKVVSDSGKKIQTTNTEINGNDYRSIIKDGQYVTSNARGIVVTTQNFFNAQSFENAVDDMSKKFFSTKSLLFQEGQYLSSNTINNWLGRYSQDNPEGLNPADNGRTDNGRAPYYLQSILENDFVSQSSANKLDLNGMAIGLAMNRFDDYTKEKYGSVYTQEIERDEMEIQGKAIGQKVLQRLRSIKDIGNNTPILLVMYENSSNDDIAGGTVYQYYLSKEGNQITKWTNIDIKNVVFPLTDNDGKNTGSQENVLFTNFQDDITHIFPTLTNATAQGHYENGIITGWKININTTFYSTSEIKVLANYISQIAPNYFSSNIPVTISIYGSNQIQAVVTKNVSGKYDINYLFSY